MTVFSLMLAVEFASGFYDLWDIFIGVLSICLGSIYWKIAAKKKDFLYSLLTVSLISLGIINSLTGIVFVFGAIFGLKQPSGMEQFWIENIRFILFGFIAFGWYKKLTQKKSSIEKKRKKGNFLKRIRYYWFFASGVFKILIFGWLIVVLSTITEFQFQSSGLVLICCAIVAEITFNEWDLYEFFNDSSRYGAVLGLPKGYRRRIQELKKETEEPWESAKRIQQNIRRILAFNIICGTIISGYGNFLV